jgi:hypothetical protein
VVAALDADHNGVISDEELDHAEDSLRKLDADGNGALEREELRPHPPGGPQGSGPHGPPPRH